MRRIGNRSTGLIAAIINEESLLVISRFRCSNICTSDLHGGFARAPIIESTAEKSSRQREVMPIGSRADWLLLLTKSCSRYIAMSAANICLRILRCAIGRENRVPVLRARTRRGEFEMIAMRLPDRRDARARYYY